MQKTNLPRKTLAAIYRRVRRMPATNAAVRAAGAALCAFALSGATLLGRPLPLCLAFLAAMPSGILSISAFCGAAVGTLLLCGLSAGLSVLAAAVLLAAEGILFCGLLPREQHWIMPTSAAFFYALLSFFSLLAEKFPPPDTAFAVFCTAALFVCTYLFLNVPQAKPVLLLTGALCATSGILLPGELTLGTVAAAAVCCLFLDTEQGVFCAAALGLTLDLAPVEPTGALGPFLAAAFVCSLPIPLKRWLKRPVFLLVCGAFCVLWGRLGVPDFVGCLLGALLSIALPKRLTARFSRLSPDEAAVCAALSRAAKVFSQMGTLVVPDAPPAAVTPAQIFDAASDEVCRCCEQRADCWEKSAKDTYLALSAAAAKFLPRGRCEAEDFPTFFKEKCKNFSEFLCFCNELVLNFRKTGQYKAKLSEVKGVLSRQYESISHALCALASPMPPPSPPCYRAEVGYRAYGVRSARISGDFGCNFEFGGKFYLLLCDGMGTGLLASEQAEAAAGLLRQMILSGFAPADAIETLGGVYLLRENGVFSTVDLLELSLETADGTLYKCGAAPSFLKVGRRVVRLGGASLPPGCESEARCERISVSLCGGVLLALASDGLDAEKAEEFLLCTRKCAPMELAAEMIAAAGNQNDDCSAAVVRFVELPHT